MNIPLAPQHKPATHPAAPTVGSIVGSVMGGVLAARSGLAYSPDLAIPAVAAVTAICTALFHWLGTKIGWDG
jgi:hypothetical protein